MITEVWGRSPGNRGSAQLDLAGRDCGHRNYVAVRDPTLSDRITVFRPIRRRGGQPKYRPVPRYAVRVEPIRGQPQDLSRRRGYRCNYGGQLHSAGQQLGHRGRQVVHRAVDITNVDIGTDGIRRISRGNCPLRHREAETGAAVPHVQMYAALHSTPQRRTRLPIGQPRTTRLSVVAMGYHITRVQQVEHVVDRRWRLADVHQERQPGGPRDEPAELQRLQPHIADNGTTGTHLYPAYEITMPVNRGQR